MTTAAIGSSTMTLRYPTDDASGERWPPEAGHCNPPGGRLTVSYGSHYSSGTPSSASTAAILPFSGSKNSVATVSQPPNSSIVEQAGRVGELVLELGEDLLVDRAVAVLREQRLALLGEEEVAEGLSPSRRSPRRSGSTPSVSIRIVSSGTVYSTSSPASIAPIASFS